MKNKNKTIQKETPTEFKKLKGLRLSNGQSIPEFLKNDNINFWELHKDHPVHEITITMMELPHIKAFLQGMEKAIGSARYHKLTKIELMSGLKNGFIDYRERIPGLLKGMIRSHKKVWNTMQYQDHKGDIGTLKDFNEDGRDLNDNPLLWIWQQLKKIATGKDPAMMVIMHNGNRMAIREDNFADILKAGLDGIIEEIDRTLFDLTSDAEINQSIGHIVEDVSEEMFIM